MVERESGKQVKAIRSDCGGEFLGVEFRSWLKWHGIKQQLTTAFTPQSNGMAERANRTIIEGGRTILVDSGLPLRFWPLAIRHATVIKNWVLTHVGGQHWVSMEKWSGKKPVVDMLRVFGDAKFMEGLMFKEWSERGRSKVTIPLGIEVGTNDPLLIPIELSSPSELTEVSHDLGGAEGEAEDVEGALQQGEAPVAERGDTEEELQQPTPSPQLPPRRTTQGKSDAVCDGAKEGEAKEMPKSCPPKGFSQWKEGIDFQEVFAPIAKAPMHRVLLAAAVVCGWKVEQMDVRRCFSMMWLKKAIYGLKQAPRWWYARLVEALEALGFKRIKEVQGKLKETFQCKALGPVRYYLGLHVERDEVKGWSRLHQHKYLRSARRKCRCTLAHLLHLLLFFLCVLGLLSPIHKGRLTCGGAATVHLERQHHMLQTGTLHLPKRHAYFRLILRLPILVH
ncbi:unnamed protein product [Closterium sp. NIES-53]